jgi:DNA-binding PadR family transcriptional regulator
LVDGSDVYYWISHSKIKEEVPLIATSEQTTRRILSRLLKNGLIEIRQFEHKTGYRLTEKGRGWDTSDKTITEQPNAKMAEPNAKMVDYNSTIDNNTETQKLQAASRPVVAKKKLEAWEEKEQIPGWDSLNSIYQGFFTVWYGLGWKFQKRDDLEDYKKRIKASLIKSGLADTTSQGTVAPHATLIEVELMRFRDHWRDENIKLPMKAWETWTNNMAKFREKR